MVELLLRFLLPLPQRPEPLQVFAHERTQNLRLLYKPAPNVVSGVHNVTNHINSAGFRDREWPHEKAPGSARIAFLGDSVVYGYRIELEDTLPKRLEQKLRRAGLTVEVLNLGVSGYETEQQVEFFKEVGLAFKPDLVVLGYSLNDSRYASWELGEFNALSDEQGREPGMGLKGMYRRILAFLYQQSRLLSFLDERLGLQHRYRFLRSYTHSAIHAYLAERNSRDRDPEGSPYRNLEAEILREARRLGTDPLAVAGYLEAMGLREQPVYSSHWRVTQRALAELAALARRHGFRVVAIVFPIARDRLDQYPLRSVHAFLDREFRALGFEVIDPLDFVGAVAGRRNVASVFLDGMHFSPAGSALLAGYLARRLADRMILP